MTDATLTDDEQLAAEYALGVLDAGENRNAERRAARDQVFAADVRAWDERLAPLADDIAPVAPPAVVWRRIAAQLGLIQSGGRPGLWRSLPLWRATTAIGAVAAAAAIAALLTAPPREVVVAAPPAQPLTSVAVLKQDEGPLSFVVTVDRAAGRVVVAPVTGEIDAGRAFQLWLLPEGGNPVSLGVLNGGQALILRTDQLLGSAGAQGALAVSLEPAGGSPTGLPTGPVVATGQLAPV